MKGQALFLALLVLLTMTVMGIGLAYVAETEYRLAVAHVRISAAFYAAESGLEYAAAMLTRQGDEYRGGALPVHITNERDEIEVTIGAPILLRRRARLEDEDGGQRGAQQSVYRVVSTAVSALSQTRACLEADVDVVPGKSSRISEFKERP